jgi:hypothetical protein
VTKSHEFPARQEATLFSSNIFANGRSYPRISCFPDLKLNCTDQDGPVRFRAALKIFATRYLFNGLPVGSEHFHFVFSVSAKMIVQSILADPAADALLAVLPPENNNFTIVDVALLRRWKRQ